MGRWSQARRTGSDGTATLFMIRAEITDTNEITVTFNRPFNSTDWLSGNFFLIPIEEQNSAQVQINDTQIEVGFLVAVAGQTGIRNENPNPPLVQNQVINLD